MALDPQKHNQRYLQNLSNGGDPLNEASNYGVAIEPVNVQAGQTYWRAIGVHHLTPMENKSNHHVYVEVLDKDGRRVKSPIAWVGWTWDGRSPDQPANPLALDKPDNEAGTNVAINKGQHISVWVKGRDRNAADLSDKVVGLHTNHPDEPLPSGELFNTIGHHSFYVVFQETVKEAEEEAPKGDSGDSTSAKTTPKPTPKPKPSKPASDGDADIDHYVLYSPRGTANLQANIEACAAYVERFALTAGFDWDVAQTAQKVTIIGSGYSDSEIDELTDAGVRVETLPNDTAALKKALSARVKAGFAFTGKRL